MTEPIFNQICHSMRADIQKETPILTGNLRYNATIIEMLESAKFRIYVDEKIAPYFKYVNSYDKVYYRKKSYSTSISGGKIIRINTGWQQLSKPNKNYKYFERAFEDALKNMAHKIGGTVIRD